MTYAPNTAALAACFDRVRRRTPLAGLDEMSPEAWASSLDARLDALAAAIQGGRWRPSPLRRISIRKKDGGLRTLGLPTVEDRIVIELLRLRLEPLAERHLGAAAFAYRRRRSAHTAVERVQHLVQEGASWVALADIRDFFSSIPVDRALAAVQSLLEPDPAARSFVMPLLGALLDDHADSPGRGITQGSALSPLLSNLVLTPMDRSLPARGVSLVRYCDNICATTSSRAQARRALDLIRDEVGAIGLSLKPSESKVAAVSEGFSWLGFWIIDGERRVSESALIALRARLGGVARRLEGPALQARLLPILRGWIQYFDAPIPQDADLGPHGALVRRLLDSLRACPDDLDDPDGPAPTHRSEHGPSRAVRHDRRPRPPALTPRLDPLPILDSPGEPGPDRVQGGLEGDEGEEDEAVASGLLPDDGADPASVLLDLADRLASVGDYAHAEAAYERARVLHDAASIPAAPAPAPLPVPIDVERVDAFLGLFCACAERFESAPVGTPGRRAFDLVQGPPSPRDVQAHLAGQRAIACWPADALGRCTLGVIDVDATCAEALGAARAYTRALAEVAASFGWLSLIEETGGRGLHLWLPIASPAPVAQMAAALEALAIRTGTPGEGVEVERLPAEAEATERQGQTMTLPLGIHVETSRRSRLWWNDGGLIDGDLNGIFARSPSAPEVLDAILLGPQMARADENPVLVDAPEGAGWSRFGSSVAGVMEGCAVLRHLAAKAEAVGHLDHGERLSLLYTLGHLGERGHKAIHAIIAPCDNYDPRETARQIDRLRGLPIGCDRLREKHATAQIAPLCCCDFGPVRQRGGYPTPALHTQGFSKAWKRTLRERDGRKRDDPLGAKGLGSRKEAPTPNSPAALNPIPVARQASPPHLPGTTQGMRAPAASEDAALDLDLAQGIATPPHTWA